MRRSKHFTIIGLCNEQLLGPHNKGSPKTSVTYYYKNVDNILLQKR
jgi:hypothetical protein